MRTNAFHNTTNEGGSQLQRYQNQALSQERRLLIYFKDDYKYHGSYMLVTPTAALKHVFSNKVPITSVRRALSNLTRDGKLIMTGKAMGPYGRPEHYWRLVDQAPQRELF